MEEERGRQGVGLFPEERNGRGSLYFLTPLRQRSAFHIDPEGLLVMEGSRGRERKAIAEEGSVSFPPNCTRHDNGIPNTAQSSTLSMEGKERSSN